MLTSKKHYRSIKCNVLIFYSFAFIDYKSTVWLLLGIMYIYSAQVNSFTDNVSVFGISARQCVLRGNRGNWELSPLGKGETKRIGVYYFILRSNYLDNQYARIYQNVFAFSDVQRCATDTFDLPEHPSLNQFDPHRGFQQNFTG